MDAPAVGQIVDGFRFTGGAPSSQDSWAKVDVPEVGAVQDGYVFKGGDPANKDAWEAQPAEPGVLDRVKNAWGAGLNAKAPAGVTDATFSAEAQDQAIPEGAIRAPGSVMDGYVPQKSDANTRAPVDDVGPMNAAAYEKARSDLAKLTLADQQKLAANPDSALAPVAQRTAEQTARRVKSDLPATREDVTDAAMRNKETSASQGTDDSYLTRATDYIRSLAGLDASAESKDERASAQAFIINMARKDGVTVDDLRQAIQGMRPHELQMAQGAVNALSLGLLPDHTMPPQSGAEEVARGIGDLAGFITGPGLAASRGIVGAAAGKALQSTAGDSMLAGLAKDAVLQGATLGVASGLGAAGEALRKNNATDAAQTIGKSVASGAEMGGVFGVAGRVLPKSSVSQFLGRAVGINAALDVANGANPFDDRSIEKKVFDYGLNTFFARHGAHAGEEPTANAKDFGRALGQDIESFDPDSVAGGMPPDQLARTRLNPDTYSENAVPPQDGGVVNAPAREPAADPIATPTDGSSVTSQLDAIRPRRTLEQELAALQAAKAATPEDVMLSGSLVEAVAKAGEVAGVKNDLGNVSGSVNELIGSIKDAQAKQAADAEQARVYAAEMELRQAAAEQIAQAKRQNLAAEIERARGKAQNGAIPDATAAEVATPSIETKGAELPGSASVPPSAPVGDTGTIDRSAEVAEPDVRPAGVAGDASAAGVVKDVSTNQPEQGTQNAVKSPPVLPGAEAKGQPATDVTPASNQAAETVAQQKESAQQPAKVTPASKVEVLRNEGFEDFAKRFADTRPVDTFTHKRKLQELSDEIRHEWSNGNSDDYSRSFGPDKIHADLRKENADEYYDADGDLTDNGIKRYNEIETALADGIARDHLGEPARESTDLTRPGQMALVLHDYLESAGFFVSAISGSGKSQSKYFDVNVSGERKKVRIADHELPAEHAETNGSADYALDLFNQGNDVRNDGRLTSEPIDHAEAIRRAEQVVDAIKNDSKTAQNPVEVAAKPSAEDPVAQATATLKAAGVTGEAFTRTVVAVRRGHLTPEEVAEAHPVKKSAQKVEPDDEVSARALIEIHPVRDKSKLDSLVAEMENNGWTGRPILVWDTGNGKFAMTGSHRIAAARKAGVDVPVIYADAEALERYAGEHDVTIDDMIGIGDERVESILRDAGDTVGANLMAQESDANSRESEAKTREDAVAKQESEPAIKTYPKAQAERMAKSFTGQGMPTEVYPHGDGYALRKPATFDSIEPKKTGTAKTDDNTGLPLNDDGTVTVYHHTSKENAERIKQTGILKADAEPDVYVTTRKEADTGYGDTAVPIRVNPDRLTIDDEFPDGRKDFRLSVGKPGGSINVDVGEAIGRTDGKRFSESSVKNPSTAEGVANELRQSKLGSTSGRLVKRGLVEIHETADTLPADADRASSAAGFFDGKTLHLIAPNIERGEAYSVLMHEGFHKLLHALDFEGSPTYGKLMSRLDGMEKMAGSRGSVSEWFKHAAEAIPEADRADSTIRQNELGAYAIQEYEAAPRNLPKTIAKWAQDMIASVRAFFIDKTGWMPKSVSAADLSAMTRRYLDELAHGEEVGPVGEVANLHDLLAQFSDGDTINIKAPKMSEQEIDDAQRFFLSHFPESVATYRRTSGMARRMRKASDVAANAIGDDPAKPRVVDSTLGPFSGYRAEGVILPGDDSYNPGGVLKVKIYGKEQIESGLMAEPALTFTVMQDGELSVNGPTPGGETFNQFQKRGWAEQAKAGDHIAEGWSNLVMPNGGKMSAGELIPLLGDVHARVRAWKTEDYTGLHWSRATGALAGIGDYGSAAFFSKAKDNAADVEEGRTVGNPYSGPGAKLLESTKNGLRNLIDDALMKAAPMSVSTASDAARAIAKDYANSERLARWQWGRFDSVLKHNYTEAQRQAMWNAADEENLIRSQGKNSAGTGKGLDGLPEDQRATMDTLHQYGEELMQRARDVGMFQGDGVPYWAPRMAVMVGEDGEYARPPSGIKGESGSSEGRNITTSASSLKQRKYLTSAETEAAMKAKLGEGAQLVRDIRTMPMAMARLERAIAGRELVEQIKQIGKKTGIDTVSTSDGPGFFTIDHPAFKTFRPHMVEEDGKMRPAVDQNGDMVFDRTPVYVSKDFEGPLKAIMSQKSGDLYKFFMDLKAKSMGLIMYSPLIHNAVEWGRAMPMMPGKVLTFKIYFEGNAIKNDPVQMRQAIKDGMVPIGHRGGVQDITGIMDDPSLIPGRSWTAKMIGGALDHVSEKAGTAAKKGIDAAGDFWHNTLLWDRIGDLQAGLYGNLKASLIKKGLAEDIAGKLAAHFANRYAGALPNEAMSADGRKIANFMLFSRSFTLGNLGVMKDMITGMPKDVQAQIRMDAGELGLQAAKSVARKKAMMAFALDLALMYAGNSLLQDALDKMKRDKSMDDILRGYADRFSKEIGRISEHPSELLNPFHVAESLTSNSENEPGKEGRIHYDDQDDGTANYIRLPTGKIGEEFKGWLTNPLDMLSRKEGTMMRPLMQTIQNDKGFGRRVYDPNAEGVASWGKNVGRIVWNFMSQQVPVDPAVGAYDWASGHADDTDKMKVLGPLVGLTMSKGAPGGPAVGEMFTANRRYEGERADIMGDVHRALKHGEDDKARDLMESIQMTVKEQNSVIRNFENPEHRLNGPAMKSFNKHATDAEKERMGARR